MRLLILLLLYVLSAASENDHPGLRAGGGPSPVEEQVASFWYEEAQTALNDRLNRPQNLGTAKNVIMFLGDGMSIPTLAAARTLNGQRQGKTGEETRLSFENFPVVGLSKTYCVNAQIPDSACTATAYLCGVKNNYGTLGVDARVPRGDCAATQDTSTYLDSIATWALQDNRDAGIVTTTRITHASPSGAYAHIANRDWESDADILAAGVDVNKCPDIAQQLIKNYPGKEFKVILGGGRREFLSNNTQDEEGTWGRRRDGRNLLEEWKQDKEARNLPYKYVWHRQQLLEAPVDDGYLLGLFEGDHLQYHMEGSPESEPALAELTEAAIARLSRNPRGYFLFVEGGRIDHAHHDNYVQLALDETIELSEAVARATNLTGDDTLIVVTSDHAHVMAFNGYTNRGHSIIGLSDDVDEMSVPYTTLSYTNGPGFRDQIAPHVRHDVTTDPDFLSLRWRAHTEVPLDSETHGGDDVGVFARGPQQHLFTGVYEQSQIPHIMAYAACIGPGRHVCDEP